MPRIIKFIKSTMQLFVPSYLKNTYQYELQTTVRSFKDNMVQFADTIFHPQGGGQPDDKGYIKFGEQIIPILGTCSERQTGKIFYKIQEVGKLKEEDKVMMIIDKQARIKHAKLHSAGHILDLAVQRLKYPFETAKGYHFIDAPYVQYKGKHQNLEQATKQINQMIEHILKQNIKVTKQVFSYDEAVHKGLIPQTFKASLIRIIHFGTSSCPCGGTHLEHVNQLENLKISKMQKKGKNIRCYYEI